MIGTGQAASEPNPTASGEIAFSNSNRSPYNHVVAELFGQRWEALLRLCVSSSDAGLPDSCSSSNPSMEASLGSVCKIAHLWRERAPAEQRRLSTIGTGENTILFMVLVLLFRLSEKVVTPTTVILMAKVSILGFLLHLVYMRDLSPLVMTYWTAAVPVAVLMGPLGALCCAHKSRQSVVVLLLALVSAELIITLCFTPLTRPIVYFAFEGLVLFTSLELSF